MTSDSPAYTSDFRPRPNLMTKEQWLDCVLNSGQVTKISQHLALVVYALAEIAGTTTVSASARDLERITGWGRSTIHDHLSELEVFINVTMGTGRAKTLFQLQSVITEALQAAVVSALPDATPDTTVVAEQPDAIVAGQPDATPDTTVVASQPDTNAASQPDTTVCGEPAGHYDDAFVASQPDATASDGKSKKEKSPHTPLKEKTPSIEEREEEGESSQITPAVCLEAFGLYNDLAMRCGLPTARTLTPQRRKSLMARMREHGGIEAWRIALANIEKSAFLQGSNDRGWRADLDFLLQASRFTKVVEGTYGNGAHAQAAAGGASPSQGLVDRMRGYIKDDDDKRSTEGKRWTR